MQTIRMTMAQALIRFIDQQYFCVDQTTHKFVEGIFSIFGHGNVTGVGEALEFTEHRLKFIRGNNEQGMAHAAIAFAKQNNRQKIYAVTTSIGPGATNLVTAAATATINRLPLLLLPGDIFASRGPDPVLQQLENPASHDISVNDTLRPVSRYFDRINRPEQIMTALIKAFKVLTDPALTGAVTIALPQDVQCEAYDYPATFFDKRVHELQRQEPSHEDIKRAAQIIAESKRPLIIAGGGVAYAQAHDSLVKFSIDNALPLCETQAGKGVIPENALTNLGGIGVIGTAAANRIAKNADCIIAIGTRLSDFVTSSKTAFAHEARIIAINIDAFDAQKLEPMLAINACAKRALTCLTDELKVMSYTPCRDYQREFLEEKQSWLKTRQALVKPDHKTDLRLNQVQVLGCLNDLCNDNAVVVAAAGSLPGDLQRLWLTKSYKGYHLEYGYSCMGYEIAGALGVKMAEPQREVWAMVGDGSFLMMHSEVVTAIAERLKINILLFDNSGFNCIKGLQTAMGSKGYGTDLRFRDARSDRLDGAIVPIDFAKIGEGMGLQTFRAKTFDELNDSIRRAQSAESSTLIDVKIMPHSQSSGSDAWWHVAVSETSACNDVLLAHRVMTEQKKRARY
jgi:3D-(3,5/4)-trihydroxycyclohexane-1,2-dione acylhydrolase (decyclizing)